MLVRLKHIAIIVMVLSLHACLDVMSGISSWNEYTNIEDVEGQKHLLEDDGIKVFLPVAFKKYPYTAYQHVLDSVLPEKDYHFELARLKNMREMEGHLYIFFDGMTRSTFTVNTIPYKPLYKQDAQYLLGMIRQGNERISEITNAKYTKLTGAYNDGVNAQIFKVVYKVEHPDWLNTVYNASYIISSNRKTLFIQLTTPFEVNFDPFLQKMII